jgi:hypothetical protein
VASTPIPPEHTAVFTAGPHGAVARLERADADDRSDRGRPVLGATLLEGAVLEALIAVPFSSARPAAVQVAPGWLAAALLAEGGLFVPLYDESAMKARVMIKVGGAHAVSLRLGAETLTVADDRGRVLVIELAQGSVVRDARV